MPFIDPTRTIAYFELRPDTHIADFGTGNGDYAIAMSRAVLPNGKVYAVDVQKDLLLRLKNALHSRHITNVELLWGDIEALGGTKIADRSVDFVLVSNVLFQAKGAGYKVALEAKRVLRPEGRVAVIDWSDSFGHLGPHPEDVVPAEEAKKMFQAAGFQFSKEFPAGDHHYGLIFEK